MFDGLIREQDIAWAAALMGLVGNNSTCGGCCTNTQKNRGSAPEGQEL